MTFLRRSAVAALAVGLGSLATSLPAQGTLSTQGFGYPPGQVSARARAMGGALAEFDPVSPVNPAALAEWGRSGLYLEYGPELRTVRTPRFSTPAGTFGGDNRTTLIRFPLIAGGLALGERAALVVSASTFLDRTWRTDTRILDTVGGQQLRSVETASSQGAMNDIRLGLGYRVRDALRVGVGVHAITGENRVQRQRTFDDSSQALPFSRSFPLSFSGAMVSAGVEWRPSSVLSVAASGRFGGTVRAAREDTLKAKAEAPHRFGIGIQFTGLRGLVLAAGVEEEQWSRMRGLVVGAVDVNDVRTWRLGVEGKGPRWFGAEIPLRVGFHARELPFAPRGQTVEERSLAGGVGVPLAANRARFDLTLERALRRVDGGAGLPEPEENAWLIGVGFTIRL